MRPVKLILRAAALSGVLVTIVSAQIRLQVLGTHATGIFNQSGAEVEAYDASTRRLYSTNTRTSAIDVIDISNPAQPRLVQSIDLTPYGRQPNSVDARGGIVVAVVENNTRTDPGQAIFFDSTSGRFLSQVRVGAVPDKVTFTPDGRRVLVANEGEPNPSYTIDPEGSVSIIDISGGAASLTQANVVNAHFRDFPRASLPPDVRITGPGATVPQDMEPEYITVSADSRTAWVTLQENNAIGVLDLEAGRFTAILPLGYKDHRLPRNGLDASDGDGRINIANWPVLGMYQPDGIANFRVGTETFLVTANEGDPRPYAGFDEEARVSTLRLDPTAFPDAERLKLDINLGRLLVTGATGDTDGDGDFDRLHSFGGRSFSIWTVQGALVYDSGEDFERITAAAYPGDFNATHDSNRSFDERSDNRGPEPESVAVGEAFGTTYAFICLERMGGVLVYDLSNPRSPRFVQYLNNRDFTGSPANGTAGDLGPEGMTFIRAQDSPTASPLLVVSNEVSGTITIYGMSRATPAPRINPAGLVSNADNGPRYGPGGIVSLYSTGLATSRLEAGSVPLPTLLGDTRVTMDGVEMPLYFVSELQINAQVPFEMQGKASASMVVTVLGVASPAVTVPIAALAPGLYPGAIQRNIDFTTITAANPAVRSEAIIIYATGLGAVSPAVASGAGAPSAEPLARTTQRPVVTIGNMEAPLLFSGLTPGAVGLYQLNVTVPAGAPTGDSVQLTVAIGNATSNTVTLAVR